VMDMELSVLLVVLSSTQLPSISFLLLLLLWRERSKRDRDREGWGVFVD
jgi:hypothetical protein